VLALDVVESEMLSYSGRDILDILEDIFEDFLKTDREVGSRDILWRIYWSFY